VFVDADYSQIELRILAHMSGDEKLIDAYRQEKDIHRITASQVFHVPFEEVTDLMRRNAKAVNFGIVYGISAFSLSEDIGVTRAEADRYIKSYYAKYPSIEEYLSSIVEAAKEQGYVTTIFGRRRYIPELSATKKAMQAFGARVAMNSPIQGAAAGIIKLAMIAVDRALRERGLDARLILQVHDELILEAHNDCAEEAAKLLKEEMERVVSLPVAMEVEVGVGKNWLECHG
jgi:DNA polymerase-1